MEECTELHCLSADSWWTPEHSQRIVMWIAIHELALLILVASQFWMTVVAVTSSGFAGHVGNDTANPDKGVAKMERRYALYNNCSQRFIQINDRKINAKAHHPTKKTRLLVTSVSFESTVVIQTPGSGKYLCFNRKGRPMIRHKQKGKLCQFKEIMEGTGHTQFQSAANPDWFLGFTKSGTRMSGNQYMKKRRFRQCRNFMKYHWKHPRRQEAQPYAPNIRHEDYERLAAEKT